MPRFIKVPLIVLAVLAAGYVMFRGSTRQEAGQIADCKARYAGARTRAAALTVCGRYGREVLDHVRLLSIQPSVVNCPPLPN